MITERKMAGNLEKYLNLQCKPARWQVEVDKQDQDKNKARYWEFIFIICILMGNI